MSCITTKCVSLIITLFCFIGSLTCIGVFIKFSNNKDYEFLKECSVFLLIFSYISSLIYCNIDFPTYDIPKTKVVPTSYVDIV